MKQDKYLFLTATIASILSLYDLNAYADKVVCPAGKMLPAGYEYCIDCTTSALTLYIPDDTRPESFYCPGGAFAVNAVKTQGIQMCSAETLADSKHKRCNKRNVSSARALKLDSGISVNTSLLKSDLNLKTSVKEIESVIKEQKLGSIRDNNQLLTTLKKLRITCPAGKYLPAGASSCKDCKDRYYCLGGTFLPLSTDQGLKACTASSKNKACTTTNSPKKVTCPAGQYLPANVTTCADCKDRYYCLGGTFTPSNVNQGLRICTTSSKDKRCVTRLIIDKKKDPHISCSAGQYLPLNENHCTDCLANYYCEGGKWLPDASMNNGLVKCADGLISAKGSKKASDCVKPEPDMVTCPAGQYLPRKLKECKECPGTNKYCPGVGPVRPSDLLDQGVKVCPLNTTANNKKSACQISLTKDMMRYGYGKTSSTELDEQCWTKATSDYEQCMFGGKINIVAPVSSEE